MKVGEPIYNTEQRREILRQMKEYFDKEWLKRKAAGRLSKRKIPLPNAEPIKKKKRTRKRRIREFKVIEATKCGDQIVFKHVKTIKRKNRKYKNGRHFKRNNRRFFRKSQ